MRGKDIQRGWRKVTEAVAALNTPKCRMNCGRPAVRETQAYGPLCEKCFRTMNVILSEKPRRSSPRKKR